MKHTLLAYMLVLISIQSCNLNENKPAQGEWIKGSNKEQVQTIEKQFRGFDLAMVETGYRYQELYWAGRDKNWEYASYQLDKIRIAVENGLQRRPKRAASARHFLTQTLPAMKGSIEAQDTALFFNSFRILTVQCNNCHSMEKVPYFEVKEPEERQSPIKK